MPATQTVFGLAQTINSASYNITRALDNVAKLGSLDCIKIALAELKNLHAGQSMDLYWTCNLVCPQIEMHLKSLDDKTGGLFRLLFRLMEVLSPSERRPNLLSLTILLVEQSIVLRNILSQRRVNGKSSPEHMRLILQLMERSGSLNYTIAALRKLQTEIDMEVKAFEIESGTQNSLLREMLCVLYV
ncbi:Ophiobolin F synthase [Tolypocladium ophioglossoides CBS 100239]|uniref:Ophiobolin F synthase n=1 Tax=Tolypocladium ophioglossoides (strain CBS 100239) TaxID=1163406 RepID=A0A0L0MYT8_TOLOC|nr:Ophiobolin F synthase [Tolypocladium ophioglossoides CBS 100239]